MHHIPSHAERELCETMGLSKKFACKKMLGDGQFIIVWLYPLTIRFLKERIFKKLKKLKIHFKPATAEKTWT